MGLILFVQTLFGNLFVFRTLMIFHHRGLISEDCVTKTGTVFMSAMVLLQIAHIFSASTQLLLSITLALTPFFILVLSEKRQTNYLQARFLIFIDHWILNMHLGNSILSARDKALHEESKIFRTLMQPLFQTQTPSRHLHLFLSPSVALELSQISGATHSACARLEKLRDLLQQTSEFRHRSGQATLQTGIQAAVMLLLLFALIIFSIHRYGWTRCGDLVLGSSLLSVTGVFLMLRLARKTKWKL